MTQFAVQVQYPTDMCITYAAHCYWFFAKNVKNKEVTKERHEIWKLQEKGSSAISSL